MKRRLRIEQLESRALLDGSGDLIGVSWGDNWGEGESTARPDFHLADVNPNSTRYGQNVSPRDYLNQVSAWYFGHST